MSFSTSRGRRARRGGAALAILAALALALAALGQAAGQTVHAGNLIVKIEGGVSPKRLPKKRPAPITLKLEGSMQTKDGSRPPVLKKLNLEFDKHGHLYTKGLASCTVAKLESTLTAQAKRACRRALVGTGHVTAEIELPEQRPFTAGGPLLIFNGSHGNKQMLIMHVYAHVPAPTTFVTTAVIGRAHGRFGTSAKVAIPTIVSGQGSLTSFKATIHKAWNYKHRKRALLLASCPTGHLYARGDFYFAGAPKLSGGVTRPCTPIK